MAWPIFTKIGSVLYKAFCSCKLKKPRKPSPPQNKSKARKVLQALPGVGKVVSMVGVGPFTAFHLAAYIYDEENGHETNLGLALGVYFLINILTVNIVTRYFNANRSKVATSTSIISPDDQREQESAQHLLALLNSLIESYPLPPALNEIIVTYTHKGPSIEQIAYQLPPALKYIVANYWRPDLEAQLRFPEIDPTFWSPGRQAGSTRSLTCADNVGYRMFNSIILVYKGFSIFSCELSASSLILLAQIMGKKIKESPFTYNEKCNETLSPYWAIALIALFRLWLMYSTRRSFNQSNQKWLRENWRNYIIERKWREISKKTWLEAGIGILIGTAGAYFNGRHLGYTIEENILCHFLPPVPEDVFKIIAGIGALATFIVNCGLTIPAVHRKSSGSHKTITQFLEFLPFWKKIDPMMKVTIPGNALSSATGTFLAIATLANTMFGRKDLNKHPGMIIAGVVCALIAFRNSRAVSIYDYIRELEFRTEKFKSSRPQLESTIDMSEPSISASAGESKIVTDTGEGLGEYKHTPDLRTATARTPLLSGRIFYGSELVLSDDDIGSPSLRAITVVPFAAAAGAVQKALPSTERELLSPVTGTSTVVYHRLQKTHSHSITTQPSYSAPPLLFNPPASLLSTQASNQHTLSFMAGPNPTQISQDDEAVALEAERKRGLRSAAAV